MLSVLLVDDEVRTLHHLKTAVPWNHLGMEVIGTAENGLAALEFIEVHPVDLLITDIRMPGMDGLELCSEVRKRHRDMLIILLTGYADFEYARRGIELQVTDFCLKPIDTEKLTATLRRAVRQGYGRASSHSDALLDLIEEGHVSRIERAFTELGFQGNKIYLAGSIGVHNIEQDIGGQFSCKVGRHKYVYFASQAFSAEEAEKRITSSDKRAGIALYPDPVSPEHLARAISDVLVMTYQYFINGKATLCQNLVDGPRTQKLFRDLAEKGQNPSHLKSWLYDLSQSDLSKCFNIRKAFRFLNQVLMTPAMQGYSEGYFDSYEQLVADYYCLADLLEELSAGVYTHQIPFVDASFEGPDSFLAIMNYLNTHYEQAITLKSVAEDLHLNASYISQLIKAETGLTYTQYITELRIGKAKELLTHTKLSLAEISEAVGFNDYFYFIKKFKKEVGVTPGKYLQSEKNVENDPAF
jgi:two-component system response regulator YesN